MSLDRLAFRSLRARPLRATPHALGVALGVAVLFAGLATNAGSSQPSVQSTVSDLVGRADLRVAAFGETGLSPETVAAIAGTPGVEVAAPALEQRTYLGSGVAAGDSLRRRSPSSASTRPSTASCTTWPWWPARRWSTRASTARSSPSASPPRTDSSVGSPLTMQGAGDEITYRVVGIIRGDGPITGALGRTVVVPLLTAQQVFAETGVTRVDIGLTGLANAAAVSATLESRLTTQPYVLSSPQDLAAALRASTTDFQATTALIAAIALFAGAFLIFNTLSMTVTERIREVGLLRAAGATRGQVMSFMLTQALALGVIGSLVGLLAGLPAGHRHGRLRPDRSGRSASSVRPSPLDAVLIALAVGIGGHPRRRARAGPSRRSHPAGRGAQGPARPAGRPQRPAALAGRPCSSSSRSSASSSWPRAG